MDDLKYKLKFICKISERKIQNAFTFSEKKMFSSCSCLKYYLWKYKESMCL